eukprot:COSAG06_NODE_2551_length_6684_cov_3.568565_3_plen_151_part_00
MTWLDSNLVPFWGCNGSRPTGQLQPQGAKLVAPLRVGVGVALRSGRNLAEAGPGRLRSRFWPYKMARARSVRGALGKLSAYYSVYYAECTFSTLWRWQNMPLHVDGRSPQKIQLAESHRPQCLGPLDRVPFRSSSSCRTHLEVVSILPRR